MFNCTRVYLYTRKSKRNHDRTIYRVPVPRENENFFFNQDSIQASVSINNQLIKQSNTASIHITSQRFILLSQLSSIGPPSNSPYFDTFEIEQGRFTSLKTTQFGQQLLHFHIVLKSQDHVEIDIVFSHRPKKRIVEYLNKMTLSAPKVAEHLPTYFEATTTTTTTPPPSYK